MWTQGWREKIWTTELNTPFDVIVVGGGITGAGILREAARHGLRALLIEQRDFAWGTSSRSSKLVHGGLRYLATGQVHLTWTSVRERENLLADGVGLIDPLGFLIATHKGDHPGKLSYRAGLSIYDLMALQWSHRYYNADEFKMLVPHMSTQDLEGGFRYADAQTDDSRLVLRIIREGVADGGIALNYVAAKDLIRENDRVVGVILEDQLTHTMQSVRAKIVISATGVWADQLRETLGHTPQLRPLRGSHLIFPRWKLPVPQAVAFLHPLDHRPVFIYPWEGITLVGTTDLDHTDNLNQEPCISPDEVAYLMAAVVYQFPARNLTLDDIISTYAGVRPVIDTGKDDPSKESRDHVVWQDNGLLTVTGGKLTTFRVIALDTLNIARDYLPDLPPFNRKNTVLNALDNLQLPSNAESLAEPTRRRLIGRYGADTPHLLDATSPNELKYIPTTRMLWAELRWAARAEGVVHLDDLLLRRVRLGLLLPQGGLQIIDQIRAICQPELGWDDVRWETEVNAYQHLWQTAYNLPDPATIPDWHALLRDVKPRQIAKPAPKTPTWRSWRTLVILFLLYRLYVYRRRVTNSTSISSRPLQNKMG